MARRFLPQGIPGPDFYIAAIGRSGSTMIANWLASGPDRLVFIEPSFLRLPNSPVLRKQLDYLGNPPSDEEWEREDSSSAARFERLMARRLVGKRWAVKEVLCAEHFETLAMLSPPRVLITARDIRDVALSFFEKHRRQDKLERFSDRWVEDYCVREADGLVAFWRTLQARSVPHLIVRYEDFTRSAHFRTVVSNFVGWPGGGETHAQMDRFERAFEVDFHGTGVSSRNRLPADRELAAELHGRAEAIARQCKQYQRSFGYKSYN